jgi:hypothetical protein
VGGPAGAATGGGPGAAAGGGSNWRGCAGGRFGTLLGGRGGSPKRPPNCADAGAIPAAEAEIKPEMTSTA